MQQLFEFESGGFWEALADLLDQSELSVWILPYPSFEAF
jgi:hypothetical protein